MKKSNAKTVFILLMLLLTFITSFTVWGNISDSAQTDEKERIRVGCVDIDNFLVTNDNGYASGYAADYLEKIAEYTNWEYEYVRGSWAECIQWLEEGKIDLLLPAEYSQERAERFLFSNEMCCMDYAALVGRKDDDIYYEDFQMFDGMKVGMIAENYLNHLFDLYAQKHRFTVEKVYYKTGSEENAALENGEVDAIISGNMNFYENQKLLARIDFMPAYFITSKKQPHLMEAINDAQNSINLENPYYTATLHEKYYGRIERQAVGFTREESSYMQNAETVQIRYAPDYYPLYYLDNTTGQVAGIYAELIGQIFRYCGLRYEFVPWTKEENNWVAEVANTPNMIFSVPEGLKNKEKDGLVFTDCFFTVTYNLVGKRGANLNLQTPLKISVVSKNQGERREVELRYPNWEIVPAHNTEECLSFVREGKADLAFVNSITEEDQISRQMDQELVNVSADIISVGICLAMSQENDKLLKTVLNKGIKKLDTQEVEQTVFNHILTLKPQITLSSLIRSYPMQALGCVTGICLILIVLTGVGMRSTINRKKNVVLQEKNKELEKAIQVQHQLQLECEQDPLTGLKNKRATKNLCDAVLSEKGRNPYTMLVLDIDNFKNVNDEYGHLTGDRILTELSQCITSVFRGQILGRVGGDEFLVLIKDMEEGDALEELLEAFFERLKHIGLPTAVTCSVGVVVSKTPEDSFQDLFGKADQALYESKRRGKNQYVIV